MNIKNLITNRLSTLENNLKPDGHIIVVLPNKNEDMDTALARILKEKRIKKLCGDDIVVHINIPLK